MDEVAAVPTPVPTPVAAGAQDQLTSEDRRRSSDRRQVVRARQGRHRFRLAWLLIGPGLLVMLGENDGPSMLSYAATGARFGIGFFLPFIVCTFLAATVIQEMSMRVGAVTHRGYGKLVFERFGPFWGWVSVGDLAVTNLITLTTEFIAIRVGMAFFGVPPALAVGAGLALVAFSVLGGRYRRWERIALGLAMFNLVFVVVALQSHPDTGAIARAFATWSPLGHAPLQVFLLLVASNIGATLTPWMLFFQQSAVADKGMTPRDIAQGRLDTALGGLLAAVAGCAALIGAAALFTHHVSASHVQGGAGFAQALRRVIGYPGAALFALGLIEAGSLAAMTISASTAYALGEAVAGPHSFNRNLREAPRFYAANIGVALVAGAVVLIPGAPLLSITLNANLLAVVLLPAALVFLLLMANDRDLMGPRANPLWLNLCAGAITALVASAGCAYAGVAFWNALHGRLGT